MYTYDEIVDVLLALSEASLTMIHYAKTYGDRADLESAAEVVQEYCKSTLSDNAKELFDKLSVEDRLIDSPQCEESFKIMGL